VVTVLGTEFNVLTRDDDFYVSCFEGLVKVQTADTTLQLPAGYGVRIFGGMFNYIAQENIGTKPLWMIGESHFYAEPLALVLDEVTRQYDVTFTFDSGANNLAQSAQFSGSFPHDDLELTLKSICQPFGLVFDLEGDQIRLTLNNDPKDP
jgi:transmembrane sensor